MMFIISPDLGNELRCLLLHPPCFLLRHHGTMAQHREFVYFDVGMIRMTDKLLIVSQTMGESSRETSCDAISSSLNPSTRV
jgi:hypothetical protein